MKRILSIVLAAAGISGFVSAQESFILGKLGTEGEIIAPMQIKEGPDGNIYVSDRQDSCFKVFGPEGKFLSRLSGKGQGPGEIQRADGLSFGFTPDGKLFFTEFFGGHRWITLLDLNGDLFDTVDIQKNEVYGVLGAYCLEDGSYLMRFSTTGEPKKEKDYFLHRNTLEIAVVDSDGRISKPFNRVEAYNRISLIDRGGDSEIPFVPVYAWCPFEKGTILFSDGSSPRLKVIDVRDRLVKEILTPLPEPSKVTKRDLDAWKKRRKEFMMMVNPSWYNQFGKVIEDYNTSIFPTKPVLSSFELTPAGNILLTGRAEPGERARSIWLLDKKGKKLFEIVTQSAGVTISDHFIFLALMDEEDTFTVHVRRRSGSDAEDLAACLE